MNPNFMAILQSIRTTYGKPMIIASGFRSISHPRERVKEAPGEHTYGMAADIKVYGYDALRLVQIALAHNIKRIGVNQSGTKESRFIHLGYANSLYPQFLLGIWSY